MIEAIVAIAVFLACYVVFLFMKGKLWQTDVNQRCLS